MFNQIIITIFVVIVVFVALFLLFKKLIGKYFNSFSEKMIENTLKLVDEKNKEIFKDERERIFEHLNNKKDVIGQEIKNNKDVIRELIGKIEGEIKESHRKIEHSEKERIGEFSNLKTRIEEHKIVTEHLRISTDNLKNILSNNQLRGKYGEEVAENLLRMAGFVKGVNYDGNISQETNANRPDFTVYLPDKSKVNIDVKFPYQALVKYQEVESELEKKKYFAQFKIDVKQKIKQITSRDYINPEEKTLDFVILFVPNEMIFSFITDRLNDVVDEANRKKVTIVGPISFITLLRIIHQSYDNFKIQKDLHRVVALINKFKQEFGKYNVEFDKLGTRIESISTQYRNLASTRTRQLIKVVDQIEEEKTIEEKKDEKLTIE